MRRLCALTALALSVAVASGCGGGGTGSTSVSSGGGTTTPSTANTITISANAGAPGVDYVNGAFASVTICVPNTTNCQTIDNILVDTGSSGLRIMSTVLTLSLPQLANNAQPVAECTQFQDGSFTWGSVRSADIKLAGEVAKSVPMQVIGDPNFPAIPSACSSSGPAEDTVIDFGANGVLGIGEFIQDCGPACTVPGTSNAGFYYTCPSSGCSVTALAAASQVQNPVVFFSADNNGTIISLPQVDPNGQPSATGTLTFGIGTQSDNALTGVTVLTVDPSTGNFNTVFNGRTFSDNSFIDSGSNGYFFLDSKTTGMPTCTNSSDFYCPTSTQSFALTNTGFTTGSSAITIQVANAQTLFNNQTAFEYNNLAGPNAGSFDFGLSFFFGRKVYTAIEGHSTPGGTGPYFAY
jgi:hypothetical protein